MVVGLVIAKALGVYFTRRRFASRLPENVMRGEDGKALPCPGYDWLSPNDATCKKVRWVAGLPHRELPNVLAGDSEGKWRAAPGFRWLNSEPGDFRVVPVKPWERGGSGGQHESAGEERIQRIKDLATLGLDEGAVASQVEAAFRRLVKLHHPDRFMREGAEAVQQATRAFALLRKAYERIKSARTSGS